MDHNLFAKIYSKQYPPIHGKMRIKYPRTYHLPWSLGSTDDDKKLSSIEHFKGQQIVVTEKMDGENTTLYQDGYVHARSIDSKDHPSRSWVKNWWSERCYNLPQYWRLCGENVYAKHSISYSNLESYFYGFSVWDTSNNCLDWDFTLEFFSELGVTTVPILYEGLFDSEKLISLAENIDYKKSEGYVVRVKNGFNHSYFDKSVAKFVRPNHVSTSKHWTKEKLVKNELQ